jgi:AraC-like DNA-binding protein
MAVDFDWLLTERDVAVPATPRFVADDENWRGSVERIGVSPGLDVYLNDLQFHRGLRVESMTPSFEACLVCQVPISGAVKLTLPDGTRATPSRDTAVMLGRRSSPPSLHSFEAGTKFQSVAYVLDAHRLERLLGDTVPTPLRPIIDGTGDNTIINAASDGALRRTARGLFSPALNGPLRLLAIEGAVMQLFAGQVARVPSEKPAPRRPELTRRERAAIVEARERLIADMRHPPTLGELAGMVGLSEKRLNQGFRLLFGATVFETLRNERLEHARQALESEAASLKQVAYRVGFKHISNFVSAFNARFGAPPRRYLERRNRSGG